ncbi:hypothetical protein BDZ91DRAFT_236823 [Kalaharituber pfeilii]|nr:hypothetical protein BDZ91DRAFT_236823 [Kalaharituber pfeilii]
MFLSEDGQDCHDWGKRLRCSNRQMPRPWRLGRASSLPTSTIRCATRQPSATTRLERAVARRGSSRFPSLTVGCARGPQPGLLPDESYRGPMLRLRASQAKKPQRALCSLYIRAECSVHTGDPGL